MPDDCPYDDCPYNCDDCKLETYDNCEPDYEPESSDDPSVETRMIHAFGDDYLN